MNINNLYYFSVLAEELHFGKTAKKLHITQPPLTRSVQQLEEELEVILFKRNQRKVVLTPAGEYFKQQVETILKTIAETKNKIRKITDGTEGTLHIVHIGSVFHIIQPLLREFTQRYPKVKLKLTEYTDWKQVELIKYGSADIAFLRSPICPIHTQGLQIKEIYREPFVLITPENIDISINKEEDLKKLSRYPFVLFSRSLNRGTFDQIISLCDSAGFSPGIIHEATQFDTIVKMVETGLGISIIPQSSVSINNTNIKTYRLDFMPQQALLSCYYRKEEQSPILKNLLNDIMAVKI